jgi:PAS domain S-box-containing protein
MAQASYSFLDVAALDGVRERFARGEALVILSADLNEVIWANGPGAALLGHSDVETIFGAGAPIGPTARRQISALRGFPDIGRDRALLVRIAIGVSSNALPFQASTVSMPDGEEAILLAHSANKDREDERAAAGRAISGFAQGGHFVAILDGAGTVQAASSGFDRLGLTADVLASLSTEATPERPIVKRVLSGGRGQLPAGLARLTANRNLIVVVDEKWSEQTEEPEILAEEPVRHDHEIWYLGTDQIAEAAADADEANLPQEAEETDDQQPVAGSVEPAMVLDEPNAVPDAGDVPEPLPTTVAATENTSEPEPQDEAPPVDIAPAETASAPRAAGPVRFVWRTDAEGRFSQISADFAAAVGVEAADVVGRSFQDVARVLGLDPTGDIAGLMARRDTWSGRTVSWPVAGTELTIPVDLAALPVYDRNRNFEGFRGFGVARTDNPSPDPHAIGLALAAGLRIPEPMPPEDTQPPEETAPSDMPAEPDIAEATDSVDETPTDPFKGEKPALSVTPAQDRRYTDKIIRLAEHRPTPQERPAGSEKSLSSGERIAFQQIAERLRKDSGQAANDSGTSPAEAEAPVATIDEPVEHATEPDVIDADDTDAETVAELEALDGVTPGETEEQSVEPVQPERKRPRPGMSLLDFAQWSKDEPGAEPAASPAPVEIEAVEQEADPDAVLLETDAGAGDQEFAETDFEPVSPSVEQAIEAQEAAGEDEDASESPPPANTTSGLSILEKLPVPVLVHSGDRLHYANHEFSVLTGYGSIEELAEAGGIGALFADPYEDAGNDELHPRTDRAMRLKTRDGQDLPVEAFLQSIPWNGGKALILVLSRVKEGSQSPSGQSPLIAELEARVAEMRTIIDTATDGVVLISREGNIRSISRPAEALFGIDSDDVAGKPFSSLFAIESQKSARDYLNGLTDHGVASVLNDGREVIGREAEGRFIPLFMTIGKLPGDSGYCAVVRDITQWKRAEEELTQARSTAERASSHKTDFLARVSHEIRTPLNAIIGFSELMLDEKFGPVANDRYRDYLRDINRSGNHVLDLVNDLLDISKIEAGQQEMAYEAVSLNETLSETVALMQPQANRERVIIRSSFASKLPDVVADLRSVRQIALNVLSNAVRYTQAGGQVIVSTAYETDGEVVMRVRDTGIGMTPAEIEQALKPFKQINSLKRTRGDGTGLGLPLTKAMVEANRARFSIHSTPGEGTLVEVAFPPTRVLAD